ncbi:hypothetical protein BDV12DRAFT_132820 [Aspergillus spectabilis]
MTVDRLPVHPEGHWEYLKMTENKIPSEAKDTQGAAQVPGGCSPGGTPIVPQLGVIGGNNLYV